MCIRDRCTNSRSAGAGNASGQWQHHCARSVITKWEMMSAPAIVCRLWHSVNAAVSLTRTPFLIFLPYITITRLLKKDICSRIWFTLSRCSKLFNIILSKYFYFESRSCTAFVYPALSHIARYAPSHRTNNYGTITQFKCKNNFEHLLTKNLK